MNTQQVFLLCFWITFNNALPEWKSVRLPTSLRPDSYVVTFHPHIYPAPLPSHFTFEGDVQITFTCLETTSVVRLHTKALKISNIAITASNPIASGTAITNVNNVTNGDLQFREYAELEMLEIDYGHAMAVGSHYVLHIKYEGAIDDNLKGVYYSPYTWDNQTKYIVTTMMEPTDARMVFPCWDEPHFKATFQMNVVRHVNVTSLSNMPLVATKQYDGDLVLDEFATSVKMSTYLVAVAIGDISCLETTVNAIQLQTCSRSETVHLTSFAMEVGAKVIAFYEDFFQIKYPLPKLTMVSVPTLIFNAMEHWGMITYREESMLYEPGVSTEADREWTAILVAHEISHQWFGNIVSPRWWDDLWLNEGFATYMMFLAVDTVYPTWSMMNKMPVKYRGLQSVFSIDDVLSAHPVYVPVYHPDEINEIFDLISYAKASAVIRMMNFVLGDRTFRNGLTRYLNRHSYSTAAHTNLLSALEEQSHIDGNPVDVSDVMHSWLMEKNYPVVMVTRVNATLVELSQSPFLMDAEEQRNRASVAWWVPFVYTTGDNPTFMDQGPADIVWLSPNPGSPQVRITVPGSSWVLGNVRQVGYFRVNYDVDNWRALIDQLRTNHTVIHPINRAQIINDACNLARSGMTGFEICLGTFDYLNTESDFVPWKAALKELGYISRSLQLSPIYGDFQLFMQKKLSHVFEQTSAATSHYDRVQRSLIAEMACQFGLPACVDDATARFTRWMHDANNTSVDVNIKTAVYCTGVRTGGRAAWDFVYRRYQQTPSPSERKFLLEALACTEKPWIISKLMENIVKTEIFSTTDKIQAVRYLSTNAVGRLMTWDFLMANWDYFFNKYGSGLNLFASLINAVTAPYNAESELKRLEELVKHGAGFGTATREIRNAISKTKANLHWMERHYTAIHQWLKLSV